MGHGLFILVDSIAYSGTYMYSYQKAIVTVIQDFKTSGILLDGRSLELMLNLHSCRISKCTNMEIASHILKRAGEILYQGGK